MSDLLKKGVKLAEQEEYIAVLDFSAKNLMGTVDEIIDFNNLEHGQVILQSKPFFLTKTLINVHNTFKLQATQKGLQFEVFYDRQFEELAVQGDELRFSQLLFHLIGNAVKFTDEGFVSISMDFVIKENKDVDINFEIKDSGIGISAAKLKQIFNPFRKKIPRTQRQYQTTLGLTIAYQLLKLHGSELTVQSVEGEGTAFLFSLHYKQAEQIPITPVIGERAQEKDISKLRILAVDDEKFNLLVLNRILARWDIKADEVLNGKMAVDRCMNNDYDIVLMDINMPIMDGFEASKQIKNAGSADRPAPRIIALTASIGAAMDEVNDYPFIDDCLLKPFDPEDLRAKLAAD